MDVSWLTKNWFPLVQSLGIAGSLLFAGITLQRDLRARRTGDQLLLNEQHQRLWREVQQQPELARVLRTDFDPKPTPITDVQEQFLRLVFVHFQNGWLIAREGALTPLSVLARDAADFFRLPGPAHLWEKVLDTHDPDFVRFIEEALASPEFSPSAKDPSIEPPTAKNPG